MVSSTEFLSSENGISLFKVIAKKCSFWGSILLTFIRLILSFLITEERNILIFHSHILNVGNKKLASGLLNVSLRTNSGKIWLLLFKNGIVHIRHTTHTSINCYYNLELENLSCIADDFPLNKISPSTAVIPYQSSKSFSSHFFLISDNTSFFIQYYMCSLSNSPRYNKT